MLQIKTMTEYNDVLDFVLSKSLKSKTASYIRLYSKEDVINELSHQIENVDGELFGVYHNDTLYGVICYFWVDVEEYMQTTVFLIEDRYTEVAEFAIKHMKKGKENYKLFIGMPTENTKAIEYLSKAGKLSENSINLILESYDNKHIENDNVIMIDSNNFSKFELFYEKFALRHDMYWNSKNLLLEIHKFDIFIYKEQKEIVGCIFSKKGKINQEIYGLFTDSKDLIIYNDLLNELLNCIRINSEKLRVTYFIDPHDSLELSAAKNAGFIIQDTYKGFEL